MSNVEIINLKCLTPSRRRTAAWSGRGAAPMVRRRPKAASRGGHGMSAGEGGGRRRPWRGNSVQWRPRAPMARRRQRAAAGAPQQHAAASSSTPAAAASSRGPTAARGAPQHQQPHAAASSRGHAHAAARGTRQREAAARGAGREQQQHAARGGQRTCGIRGGSGGDEEGSARRKKIRVEDPMDEIVCTNLK